MTGVHTFESHHVESAPYSGGNPTAPKQSHCNGSSGDVPLEDPMDASPSSSRKPSQYTPTGLCGWWASFWSGVADVRPSEQELRGRQLGEDGSRPIHCILNSTTGVQLASVANHVMFLARCMLGSSEKECTYAYR